MYCLSSRLRSLVCGLSGGLAGALFFSHMRLRLIVRGVGGGIVGLDGGGARKEVGGS